MLSYWEKQSFTHYDYVVIGSGIVGLSTAISLKEERPRASVIILERGMLPTGASTKNAGFACFGSLSELIHDIELMGEAQSLKLVINRYQGLSKLRKRLGDNNIGYIQHGGYELLRENELMYLNKIDHVNKLLKDVFKTRAFTEKSDAIRMFGFNSKLIKSMIYSPYEGQIDTGEMMNNLLTLAQIKGIRIITGANVEELQEKEDMVQIDINRSGNNPWTVKCRQVAVCTNAFTNILLPKPVLKPGRGIVLITKPVSGLKFKGIFHMEGGYYYFRNVGNRVLIGGGRNLDFQGEATTKFEINASILEKLERTLAEIVLPGSSYKVDQTWAGIMAFGEDKLPIVQKYSERIHLGVRLGGMGVAIGTNIGEKLAKLIIEQDD